MGEPEAAALARAAMEASLDPAEANPVRWLERAHRLVPTDPNVALALASALLAQDPARAATLFQAVLERHDVRQAWLGLAAARLRLSGADAAAEPLGVVLSRHAFSPDVAALAGMIGGRAGSPGWCALRPDGGLEIHVRRGAAPGAKGRATEGVAVLLDGRKLRGGVLPAHWERGRRIDVLAGGAALLGSPIQVAAIRRLAGCVEAVDGGISGWAWHPGDPATAPVLTLCGSSGQVWRRIVADDESVAVPDTGAMARPRRFALGRAALLDAPRPLHVRGADGAELPGSPLDPFADEAAHVAAAQWLGQVYAADPAGRRGAATAGRVGLRAMTLRADGPVAAEPVGADGRKRAVTIVVPVHNGGDVVLECLRSVLASVPARSKVLVVDDGSSDPVVVAALDDLVRRRKIGLLRHSRALGFPAAANAGIVAASGRDVVLLNSDTLVPEGWLERLRQAAYATRDTGTVTPLSNDASIVSYPGASGVNPIPDQAATDRLDRLAERANGGSVIDIPVGVGFCLYVRRDCLDAAGLFRDDVFAQGYGEENDFCLRARRLGWRNVALAGLFVGHLGGTSFGGSAVHLRARNSRLIEALHPGYAALVEDWLGRDPLSEVRRRIDLLRWREAGRRWRRSSILISHNDGGGVERRLVQAVAAQAGAGRRAIVLRPAETATGEAAIAVGDGTANDFPNLVFAMPREMPALLRLLRAGRPEMVELHHCADYPPAIYDVISRLGVPFDVHVHDYAWFCPRVSLVGAHDRYCGEPELADCETCVADHGSFLRETITVAALRQRSALVLADAGRVVVPSDDTGARMRRHFPGLRTVTVAHEDDAAIAVPDRLVRPGPAGRCRTVADGEGRHRGGGQAVRRTRVCVVGAIGVHKGYDILLGCARDAARRDLALDFIVVGHTIDDARMLATGRVFITGRFAPDEAVGLIAEQQAGLGFVASICPETWCLGLGEIWRAGLRAAAFDIGAPAERIRRSGRGILLPLGLSASAINNTLIAAMTTTEY
ncbi:MAG TPA: glycosyltransferase [Rhodopila sp.]|nr:glycosyltransferase [Rhodopila sp.]